MPWWMGINRGDTNTIADGHNKEACGSCVRLAVRSCHYRDAEVCVTKKPILERYLALNPLANSRRRSSLNLELIERWVFVIQRGGDAPIKSQIAHAKRVSTSLVKTKSNFENLSPLQMQQLSDTASMMRQLAEALVPLASWAKDYKAFYDQTIINDQIEECDAFAQARWQGDEATFQLELELLLQADNHKTSSCLGEWFHLNNRFTWVPADKFFMSLNLRVHEDDGVRARMRAVAYALIYTVLRCESSSLSANQQSVYVGSKDIDLYLAYRKAQVMATTSAAMKNLSVKP